MFRKGIFAAALIAAVGIAGCDTGFVQPPGDDDIVDPVNPRPTIDIDYSGLSWTSLGGPPGGHVYGMGQSANGSFYAWTRRRGIFVSDDGTRWLPDNDRLPASEGSYSSDHSIWPVAVGPDGWAFAFQSPAGAYRSHARGSWQPVEGLPRPPEANNATFLPLEGGLVYAAMNPVGLFRSTDYGATWMRIGQDVEALRSWMDAMYRLEDGTLLFWSSFRIMYSRDDGETWKVKDMPLRSFAAHPDGTLYRGVNTALERSTDLGETWQALLQRAYAATSISAAGQTIVASFGDRAVYSRDGGLSWTDHVYESPLGTHGSVVASADGTVFMAGAGGIRKLAPGTMQTRHVGVPARWTIAGVRLPSGRVVASTDHGVYRGQEDGTMQILPDRSWWNSLLMLTSEGTLIVFPTDGPAERSTDGGNSWAPVSWSAQVSASLVGKEGRLYAAAHGGGVYLSTDDGRTWDSLITTDPFAQMQFTGLAEDGEGGLYLASQNGLHHLTETSTITQLKGDPILRVAVNSLGDVFVGRLHGVDRRLSGEEAWEEVLSLQNSWVTWLVVDELDGVLASVQENSPSGNPDHFRNGVYVSGNNGADWTRVTAGIGVRQRPFQITPLGEKEFLVADSHYGLWRLGR
jgi:photosystem II stability/assembly factor-like uncharacterized protein